MFRKMPFILIAIIALSAVIHPFIPQQLKSILYALSLTLKSTIVFCLPFLIFGLLFKTAAQLAKKASKVVLFLLIAVCLSNFLSTLISYSVGHFAYQFDLSVALPSEGASLAPAWAFTLPKLVGNEIAMFSGLILGILLGRFRPTTAEKVSGYLETMINLFLKGFLLVLPAFILGFVVKMYHDQLMMHIFRNYALVFTLVACAVFSYITLIYLVANRFQGSKLVQSIKNMVPAAIAGFGSMSSAAAMPLTILGTEKNCRDPDIARFVIPATVNIHLIGDCFAIPIFAFAVLKNFGIAEPSLLMYLSFAMFFVLAKFSVAAVPGGGILVMLPILESNLGFNAEMLSLITALYILFDPIITCANVMGNGGFAMVMNRLLESDKNRALDGAEALQEI